MIIQVFSTLKKKIGVDYDVIDSCVIPDFLNSRFAV